MTARHYVQHLSKQVIGQHCITREAFAVVCESGTERETVSTHASRADAAREVSALNGSAPNANLESAYDDMNVEGTE